MLAEWAKKVIHKKYFQQFIYSIRKGLCIIQPSWKRFFEKKASIHLIKGKDNDLIVQL